MLLELYNNLNIFQIGCGGTGSWLVYPICKFLRNISLRYRTVNMTYTIVDDDIVEDRNVIRQNFEEYDVERNKATVMLRKYANVFPNMEAIKVRVDTPTKFHKLLTGKFHCAPGIDIPSFSQANEVKIIIGCCDNNKTRRMIFKYLKEKYKGTNHVVYIDSGNNLYHGQIVTCMFPGTYDEPWIAFRNAIRHRHPNFLKMFPLKADAEEDQSCAFFGDQSQSVNMMASSHIFSIFQNIIIDGLLPAPIINFNSTGTSYIER